MPEQQNYVCVNHNTRSHYFVSKAEEQNVKCPKCQSPLGEFVFNYVGDDFNEKRQEEQKEI